MVEVDLDRLIRLRKKGWSKDRIARKLGVGRGTVQLALATIAQNPSAAQAHKSRNSKVRKGR